MKTKTWAMIAGSVFGVATIFVAKSGHDGWAIVPWALSAMFAEWRGALRERDGSW